MRIFFVVISIALLIIGLCNLKKPNALSLISLLMGAVGIIASAVLASPSPSTSQSPTPSHFVVNSQDPATPTSMEPQESLDLPLESDGSDTGSQSAQPESKVLLVSPITPQRVAVDLINKQQISIEAVTFISYYGEIYSSDQVDEYTLYAPVSGKYRFTLSGMVSGISLSLNVYNLDGSRIDGSSSISSGGGVTVQLQANTSYIIKVKHYSGMGSYTLTIGQPKGTTDVSSCTEVYDSTEFYDQRNVYTYTPAVSGRHGLYFSALVSGFRLSLAVYDSMGYLVNSSSALSNSTTLTLELEANETYSIYVTQYDGYGSYVLNIGPQKKALDMSGYTAVSDSIEYTNQRNVYTYRPEIAGHYRLYFSELVSGFKLSLAVYDSMGYLVNSSTALSNESGLSFDLNEGEIYTIYVTHYSNFNSYILNIGQQKEVLDISGYATITDSMEFIDQRNTYSFTPGTSANYKLVLSGMDSDVRVSILVLDSAGYTVNSGSSLSGEHSLSLPGLTAGQTYNIRITQYSNFGSYTFSLAPSQDNK